jgi:DNA-binding MarR family transcriptional regulator
MAKPDLVLELSNAMRFNQNLADRFDEIVCKRVGISAIDFRCLDIVTQRTDISAGDLAKAAGISPAAVTNVIDRLEARGWLERFSDPKDRRKTLLRAGEKAGEEIFPYYQPLYEHFIASLGKMTVAQLEMQLDFYAEANAHASMLIDRLNEES